MAPPPRAQLGNSIRPPRPRRDKHHHDAYVANIVSEDRIRRLVHAQGGGAGGTSADAAAGWIASRQLELITFRQAELAGLGRGTIARRVARRTLHRQHRGVFAWGAGILLPHARELAAVLAVGASTYVSDGSALALYGVVEPFDGDVHVTVVGRNCVSRDGITVHNVRRLDVRDRGLPWGIPATSVARALLDFAATASPANLERAVAESLVQRLVTAKKLRDAIARAPTRAGSRALRQCLSADGGPAFTRSENERRMLNIIRSAHLPVPLTNHRIGKWEVDFLWPEQRLVVEVDSYLTHGHPAAFHGERRKGQEIVAAGYRLMRVTDRQLAGQTVFTAVQLARALYGGGADGGGADGGGTR